MDYETDGPKNKRLKTWFLLIFTEVFSAQNRLGLVKCTTNFL